MSFFDILLIFSISGFIFYGLFFGLIRAFGALAGVILGALLASQTYTIIFTWIKPVFLGYNNIGKFLVFIVLFSLIDRLVGLAFSILDKTFHLISIIPFLKTINRLGGAILGFIMGITAVGLLLHIGNNFLGAIFLKLSADSELMPFLLKSSKLVVFFLPIIFDKAKEWMRAWALGWGWGI